MTHCPLAIHGERSSGSATERRFFEQRYRGGRRLRKRGDHYHQRREVRRTVAKGHKPWQPHTMQSEQAERRFSYVWGEEAKAGGSLPMFHVEQRSAPMFHVEQRRGKLEEYPLRRPRISSQLRKEVV